MYRDKNARFAFELAENANLKASIHSFTMFTIKKRKKNGTKVGSKVLMPRIKWMKMDLVQLRVLSWSVHFGWGFRSIVQNKRDKKKKLKCTLSTQTMRLDDVIVKGIVHQHVFVFLHHQQYQ